MPQSCGPASGQRSVPKYLMDLLSQRALMDGLTGLWNRVYFESRLSGELVLIRNAHRPLSCLMVDMDHFRDLNTQYGHFFGDQILRRRGADIDGMLPRR